MTGSEHSFIEESIRPGKHKRIRKFFKNMGIAAAFGAVFGITAGVCFYATTLFTADKRDNNKNEVSLVVPTDEPKTEATQTPAPQAKPTDDTNDSEKKPDDNISGDIEKTIAHYGTLYKDLSAYCASFNSTLVNIARTSTEMDYFENQVERTASFYGLILQNKDKKLYILTQYDEMNEEYSYSMVLDDGTNIPAKLAGVDSVTGLAVMTADISDLDQAVADGFKVAKIGSSQGLKIGDMVVAIGNPMGTMGSVGYGVVCSEPSSQYLQDRKLCVYTTGMQNVERGNGVIMDTAGKVIGIITHRFNNDNNLCNFIGMTEMKAIIEKLMNSDGYVGMGIVPMDIDRKFFEGKMVENGIYVSDMFANTPAMSAGIVVGDIITKIDGQNIENVDEYMDILAGHGPDETIYISIYRDYASKNKMKNVEVTLKELQ